MRMITLVIAFLALPTLAMAQDPGQATDDVAPTIEVEQSVADEALNDRSMDAADRDQADVEDRTLTPDETAMQEQGPTSRSWWYLVGAIVVGGIIVAVLL